jgi:copper(I)-binding protein
MRLAAALLPVLIALAGCGAQSGDAAAANESAVIRLPVVMGRPGSGYFELQIEGDHGALLSVTSPQTGRIEMHETMMSGTVSSMRPIARIPVHDGETVRFTPGGRHLMVYDIRRGVAAGDMIELVFHFERGGSQRIRARLEPVGGDVGR